MNKKIFLLVLSILVFSLVISGSVLAEEGLIGHWKFDGNGNNEVSGNPVAVIVGNATFNSDGGKLGGYLYIPTGSDYAKIPYNSIFDLPNSFTIEFWFRQRSNQNFYQDLVYKGTPINNYNFRVFRQLWNENNFGPIIVGYTAVNTGYWSQTSNPNQLSHGSWHHVAYTRNRDGAAYYLDGVLTHYLNTTQYIEYSGLAKTPANDIIIGDSAVDTDIDNLRIYNRALSFDEVLSNGGFPTRQQICTPNSKQCLAYDLQQCVSDGYSWNNLQYCNYGCNSSTLSCKSAPPQSPPQNKTCAQLNGTVCSASQTCSGSWSTNATDTNYCCLLGNCSTSTSPPITITPLPPTPPSTAAPPTSSAGSGSGATVPIESPPPVILPPSAKPSEPEKSIEPIKRIGTPGIESAVLLGVVIQIEQLKIQFSFLKSAISKLADYYSSAQNLNASVKWRAAADMLDNSIAKLDTLKTSIRQKLSNFTLEDLRALKNDMKSTINIISEILKIVL